MSTCAQQAVRRAPTNEYACSFMGQAMHFFLNLAGHACTAARGIHPCETCHVDQPLDHPHSVPRYAALQLDASGTAHLLVAQAEALSEQAAFAAQLSGNAQASALVLGASAEPGEPGKPGAQVGVTAQYVRQQDELEDAVRQTLAAASVGTRLYLCGTEASSGACAGSPPQPACVRKRCAHRCMGRLETSIACTAARRTAIHRTTK